MATTFLEPGGDATFTASGVAVNGLWTGGSLNTPYLATDFVHDGHPTSIGYALSVNSNVQMANNTVSSTGARLSFYMYVKTYPSSTSTFCTVFTGGAAASVFRLRMLPTGDISIWETTNQIGIGTVVPEGKWFRISVAYTITSTTVNRFEVFVNGISAISVTNATITNTAASRPHIGNLSSSATFDFRTSDHYVDDSTSLTDTGDIWVTAKRPVSNGTTNGFTTQVGSGGSGYGTGHSSQVNERPLSTTNGWSMVGAGSAVTEEYNIETASNGDINVSQGRIIDCMGWVSVSSLVGETINIILNGANFSQAITSTNTVYPVIAGSSVYPSGTGTDIGIQTDTTVTTVTLNECGVVVAFIPKFSSPLPCHFLHN